MLSNQAKCQLWGETKWVSEWLVFNAKWAIFQLYHCEIR